MKPLMRIVVLMLLPAMALAQSDAQKSFDKLKALTGPWEGTVTTTPLTPEVQGKPIQVTLRRTSMGNALLHEARIAGRQDDPITMLYLDGDRHMLTHYCDAGNRPRMVAKTSPDGKTVEFDFVDVAGSTQYGHRHQGVFTFIDPNHHTGDWRFMEPGDSPVHAHFELQRANTK
jgi:hypothetical protein